MTKAKKLLSMFEAVDPAVQKVVDQLDAALQKSTGAQNYREGETGNQSGKLYKIIQDKNYADGSPVALFRVPIITLERGKSTQDWTGDATNSYQNFKKAFDPFWKLRNEGWIVTQPMGGQKQGDAAGDNQTMSNIIQFVIGKAPAAAV